MPRPTCNCFVEEADYGGFVKTNQIGTEMIKLFSSLIEENRMCPASLNYIVASVLAGLLVYSEHIATYEKTGKMLDAKDKASSLAIIDATVNRIEEVVTLTREWITERRALIEREGERLHS
jgi:hypothetical protein